LNELVIVFVSIVLQSLSFLLVGVFASAAVQRYLSASMVARWLPRSRSGLVLLSSVFGFVAPVCDCGVIPLARRLTAKGVPLYATTTFILAAPVVNPVVLLSTAFAFQEDWHVVGLRMAMTLSVDITVGLLASRIAGGRHAGALQPTVVIPIEGGSDPRPISAAEARSPGPGPVRPCHGGVRRCDVLRRSRGAVHGRPPNVRAARRSHCPRRHAGGVRADAHADGHPALDLQQVRKAGVGRRVRGGRGPA
jgi:predicted permease